MKKKLFIWFTPLGYVITATANPWIGILAYSYIVRGLCWHQVLCSSLISTLNGCLATAQRRELYAGEKEVKKSFYGRFKILALENPPPWSRDSQKTDNAHLLR